MRRLLAWVAGVAGGLLAYRAVARRRAAPLPAPPPGPAADPRAEELRARLDATRGPGTVPEPAPPAEETPEQRRARVHEQGRAAVDEMREDG